MTFLTPMGQVVSEGGSGSKSKGVAKSRQPGNDGRAEIKMYIDAFYSSEFLKSYFNTK
jgi:hypothetical protein